MTDQRTDAAERSAHVTRGDTAAPEATCCVCGKQFPARAKNQKRCPECIAIHPKWGASRHAHLEERKRKD